MLQTLSVFTEEMDDVESAVSSIMQQLEDKELQAHSIGLMSCLPDFVETGVYAALVEALPFEVIGQTTIATAVPGSESLNVLTLFVMSSDDLEFSIGLTGPLVATDNESIITSYRSTLAAAEAAGKADVSLILTYLPLLLTVSGDHYVRAFDEVSGGVPIFGSLAVDNTLDYHKSQVLFCGEQYENRCAYLLIHGETNPRFLLATIADEKISSGAGVVTKSQGNLVMEVDGAPALQFLLSKGLATDNEGAIQGLNSFPYIVDYNDGTDPVVRVIFAMTEEGYAVCLGDIPEGSTLSVGYFDDENMIGTSAEKLSELSFDDEVHGILIFSCIGRFLTLGFEPDREIIKVRDCLDRRRIPYTMTYSGGEFCPLASRFVADKLTNRFHNSTFVMLVL